jgi:tetratricopeptide (TPR) repeat protein
VYDSWFGTSEVPGENATVEGRIISFDELDDRWLQFNRNYVALFRPEEATQVAELIGPDMQDDVMWQAAFERVQQELRANTTNAFLWFNLGTIHNALGEYDDAAAAYDQARAIGLPWRMLWYQFGPFEAYYQIGRYEDVILLADVTLQDRPYFEESFYYKGLALAASGQLPAARDNLERAIAFNPGFTAAANALADLD